MESTEQLIALAAAATHDPLGYATGAYPWQQPGPLATSAGPRAWQARVLGDIGEHLRDPQTRHMPLLIAIAAGNGIGKSALIGMLTDWAMSTCEDCKVMITAAKGEQLDTKTVPEVSRWFRLGITAPWWTVMGQSIRSRVPGHEKSWRADFVTWNAENPDAFSGLHNQGKRIVIVFDEASGIDDKIWDVTAGALTDEDTEIIWVAISNPTRNSGRFAECFGANKHRWRGYQIDSRTVEGTNKAQIDQWVADQGEDADWVRVHVRGEFPRAGDLQFISSASVAACRKYRAQAFERMPKIMACDVARFGDDQTVIVVRQGRMARVLAKWRGLDTMESAARIAKAFEAEAPEALVVDGDGLGAGVVDRLRQLGYGRKLTEFHGGSTPLNQQMYANKRAEIWGDMRDALTAGMQIPDDAEMERDLTGPEYSISKDGQIKLERKEDMKKRGLASPDLGDALAMTFSVTVAIPKRNGVPSGWAPNVGQGTGWMG